jgi:hypothetical protein
LANKTEIIVKNFSQLDLSNAKLNWIASNVKLENRVHKWVLFVLTDGQFEMRGGGDGFHVDLGVPEGGTVVAAGELGRFPDGELYVCGWSSSSYRLTTPGAWMETVKQFFNQHKDEINKNW